MNNKLRQIIDWLTNYMYFLINLNVAKSLFIKNVNFIIGFLKKNRYFIINFFRRNMSFLTKMYKKYRTGILLTAVMQSSRAYLKKYYKNSRDLFVLSPNFEEFSQPLILVLILIVDRIVEKKTRKNKQILTFLWIVGQQTNNPTLRTFYLLLILIRFLRYSDDR